MTDPHPQPAPNYPPVAPPPVLLWHLRQETIAAASAVLATCAVLIPVVVLAWLVLG